MSWREPLVINEAVDLSRRTLTHKKNRNSPFGLKPPFEYR